MLPIYLPVGHIINKTVLVVYGGLFSDQSVTIDPVFTTAGSWSHERYLVE
jgi:hypothetical protein